MTPLTASVVTYLMGQVFLKDGQRHDVIVQSLIERNHALGNPVEGFLFGGRFWSFYPKNAQRSLSKRVLHLTLQQEATLHMADVTAMEKDQRQLQQRLNQLLRDCQTVQDVRDALPEVAMQFLSSDVTDLQRYKSPGWPFQNKPLMMADFARTTEILLFYAANRMLY